MGRLGNADARFCQGYQGNVCSVSLMIMEGAVEVKKAGILPLIPFSGYGAPLIQADNPFSCFNVAWFIIPQTSLLQPWAD